MVEITVRSFTSDKTLAIQTDTGWVSKQHKYEVYARWTVKHQVCCILGLQNVFPEHLAYKWDEEQNDIKLVVEINDLALLERF